MGFPIRARLPNRRKCETTAIEAGGQRFSVCVGFEREGQPAELFLSGAKDGSGMAVIAADPSVVISIALQHGIAASALAKSIGRIPAQLDGPATEPASVIGAALDLVAGYESD